MDKYEFNIKVEQLKKLISKGDYETAVKIADGIDWHRVRNANLLSMVAQVYEKTEDYQEAKDILLLAFERAPIGKRLLFKLAELALKEGSVEEAEAYYREFCDLAPDDSRQYLLRYLILKQKDAPIEQLIHSLESFTAEELDEKWFYELASLYQQAGNEVQCVELCDKIMLMFGLGKYVDKAMELKIQFAPLTGYQMDLVENRDKYEQKLRSVEESVDIDIFEETEPEEIQTKFSQAMETKVSPKAVKEEPDVKPQGEHQDFVMAVKEAEVEEHLAEEMTKISLDEITYEDIPAERTRILGDLKSIIPMVKETEEAEAVPSKTEAVEEEKSVKEAAGGEDQKVRNNYLLISARTREKGFELAVEALKELQTVSGVKYPVAKITGANLNRKGLIASEKKLEGRDLIIEEAGDLSPETMKELFEYLNQEIGDKRILLVDNPKQIEMMARRYPSLLRWFSYDGRQSRERMKTHAQHGAVQAATPISAPRQAQVPAPPSKQTPTRILTPTLDTISTGEALPVSEGTQKTAGRPERQVKASRAAENREPVVKRMKDPEPEHEEDEVEMDIDEFAEYACKYATEIDCSITGKSMLALYERIEILEEDGIELTKSSAEELIEEAADKAEKPSLGKLVTGVFSSKYDKDGLLILKEEHFI